MQEYKRIQNVEIGKFTLVILLILFLLLLIIGIYYSSPRYNYYDYEGYTFSFQSGDEFGLGEEESNEEDNNERFYFKHDDIMYDIKVSKDNDYSSFLYDDYQLLREFFASESYGVTSIKEVKYEDHNIIVAKITHENKTYYFYVFKINDTKDIITGYVYPHDDDEIEDSNLKYLYDTLIRVKRS